MAVVFDEAREMEEALECLRSTYSVSDYEPESPNHAEELTYDAFAKSSDALIKPFADVLKRYYANRR